MPKDGRMWFPIIFFLTSLWDIDLFRFIIHKISADYSNHVVCRNIRTVLNLFRHGLNTNRSRIFNSCNFFCEMNDFGLAQLIWNSLRQRYCQYSISSIFLFSLPPLALIVLITKMRNYVHCNLCSFANYVHRNLCSLQIMFIANYVQCFAMVPVIRF